MTSAASAASHTARVAWYADCWAVYQIAYALSSKYTSTAERVLGDGNSGHAGGGEMSWMRLINFAYVVLLSAVALSTSSWRRSNSACEASTLNSKAYRSPPLVCLRAMSA